MKYTPELTKAVLKDYADGMTVLEMHLKYDIPKHSLVTKLTNLGVYKPKKYRNKQGEIPIKKSAYIEQIAALLDVPPDRLDSLEKSNKWILARLTKELGKGLCKPEIMGPGIVDRLPPKIEICSKVVSDPKDINIDENTALKYRYIT